MTRQNRVLPTGEIVTDPARGTMMGNRGILHDANGRLGAARWRHKAWIVCKLAFKGRHRAVMTPGRYTELFFLDEAVALAAGHRPCAECRRAAFLRFLDAWEGASGERPRAAELDHALHTARLIPGTRLQARFRAKATDLPDGTFVFVADRPHLVVRGTLRPFAPDGYGPAMRMPDGEVDVLTPRPSVATLRAGYRPELHWTVRR